MAEEVVAPGEAATPPAAPLVMGPLGRVSPLRMNKTMIRRTTAGITTPLLVARPHGAVSAPPSMKRYGTQSSRLAPRMNIWIRELGGGQGTLSLAQGTAGPPDLMAQAGGGPNQAQLPPVAPPQQGAAQVAVQPAAGLGRSGAGTSQPPTGTGPTGTPPQDFSGI